MNIVPTPPQRSHCAFPSRTSRSAYLPGVLPPTHTPSTPTNIPTPKLYTHPKALHRPRALRPQPPAAPPPHPVFSVHTFPSLAPHPSSPTPFPSSLLFDQYTTPHPHTLIAPRPYAPLHRGLILSPPLASMSTFPTRAHPAPPMTDAWLPPTPIRGASRSTRRPPEAPLEGSPEGPPHGICPFHGYDDPQGSKHVPNVIYRTGDLD